MRLLHRDHETSGSSMEDHAATVRDGEVTGRSVASELSDPTPERLAAAHPAARVRAAARFAHAGLDAGAVRELADRARELLSAAAEFSQKLDRLRDIGVRAVGHYVDAQLHGLRAGRDHLFVPMWTYIGASVLPVAMETVGFFHIFDMAGMPVPLLFATAAAVTLTFVLKLSFDAALRLRRASDAVRKGAGLGLLWVGIPAIALTVGGVGFERVAQAIAQQIDLGLRTAPGFTFTDYSSAVMPVVVAIVGGLVLALAHGNTDAKKADLNARRFILLRWRARRSSSAVARTMPDYLDARVQVAALLADVHYAHLAVAATEEGTKAGISNGLALGQPPGERLPLLPPHGPAPEDLVVYDGASSTTPNVYKLTDPDIGRLLTTPVRTFEESFRFTSHVAGEPLRVILEAVDQIVAEARSRHDEATDQARHLEALRARTDLSAIWDDVARHGRENVARLVPAGDLPCGCTVAPVPADEPTTHSRRP